MSLPLKTLRFTAPSGASTLTLIFVDFNGVGTKGTLNVTTGTLLTDCPQYSPTMHVGMLLTNATAAVNFAYGYSPGTDDVSIPAGNYTIVPKKFGSQEAVSSYVPFDLSGIFSNAVDVSDYLVFGDQSAATQNTVRLNAMIASGGWITVRKSGTFYINASLKPGNYSRITLGPNTTLKLADASFCLMVEPQATAAYTNGCIFEGGIWDGNKDNNPYQTNGHVGFGLCMYGFCNSEVRDLRVINSPGYGIRLAASTGTIVRDITGDTNGKDLVHVVGPCSRFKIHNVESANAKDNPVGITCADYLNQIYGSTALGMWGDIVDFEVRNVTGKESRYDVVRLIAMQTGSAYGANQGITSYMRGFLIDGVHGNLAVLTGGDAANNPGRTGAVQAPVDTYLNYLQGNNYIEDGTIRNCNVVVPASCKQIDMQLATNVGSIKFEKIDVTSANATDRSIVIGGVTGNVTFEQLRCVNAGSTANQTPIILLSGSVKTLTIEDANVVSSASATMALIEVGAAASFDAINIVRGTYSNVWSMINLQQGATGRKIIQGIGPSCVSTATNAHFVNSRTGHTTKLIGGDYSLTSLIRESNTTHTYRLECEKISQNATAAIAAPGANNTRSVSGDVKIDKDASGAPLTPLSGDTIISTKTGKTGRAFWTEVSTTWREVAGNTTF